MISKIILAVLYIQFSIVACRTRAMQKLLENLTTQNQKSSVVSVLKHITLTLTKSMNGHHVIQQCLKLFTNEQIKVYNLLLLLFYC